MNCRKIVFVFVLVALAFAVVGQVLAQAETPPEVSSDLVQIVWSAAQQATPIALVIAFATVIVGYLSKTPPEDFKLSYFIFTILISFAVAMLTTFFHWTYADIQTWLANGFLTWYIWKGATILAKIITKTPAATQASSVPSGPGPPA